MQQPHMLSDTSGGVEARAPSSTPQQATATPSAPRGLSGSGLGPRPARRGPTPTTTTTTTTSSSSSSGQQRTIPQSSRVDHYIDPVEAHPATLEQFKAARADHGLGHVETHRLLFSLVRHLERQQQLQPAIDLLRGTLKDIHATLAPSDAQYYSVQTSAHLAKLLTRTGQHQAAWNQYKGVLPRIADWEAPEAVCVMELACYSLVQLDRRAEALPLLYDTYAKRLRVHGCTGPECVWLLGEIASCRTNLAAAPRSSYVQQLEQSVAQLRASNQSGQHNESLFYHIMALVECMKYSNDVQTQNQLSVELVALAKKVTHPQHFDYLHSLTLRAGSLMRSRQYAKAASLLQSVLHTRKTLLGRSDKTTLVSANTLGLCFAEAGRDTDAVEVYRTAWADGEGVWGREEQEQLVLCRMYLACLKRLGLQEEFEQVVQQAAARGVRLEAVAARSSKEELERAKAARGGRV